MCIHGIIFGRTSPVVELMSMFVYLGVTGVDRGVVVPMLPCSMRLDVDPRLCMEERLGSLVYLLPSAPGVSDRDR